LPDITLLPPSILDQIVLYGFSTVHPLPPTGLAAIYTTDPLDRNGNRIKLSWTPAPNQPDVALFRIYRNGCAIGTVPVGTTEFIDPDTGGDVSFFTYYVSAIDVTLIEGPLSESICNFTQTANRFIDELRRSLKDSPPDPRVQRWTDDDLWLALRMAISRINAIPMNTNFNFDTLPPDLFAYVIVAARIAALRSQASLEAAKEFSMGVGGTSININRSGVYNTLLSSEEQAFATEIKSIKLNFTMRTVHGEGILTSPLPFRIRTFAPRQFRVR